MSVGSVIKKVTGAASSVGQAVLGPGGVGVLAPSQPAPTPSPAPAAPPTPAPLELPTLDPSDPDYEEKKAVHDAYTRLNDMLMSSAKDSNIDYAGKYKELADYAASRPQPKKWSPFSTFAIAMGSPAGAAKVAGDNSNAEQEAQKREDYLLGLKEQALKGDIAQQMEKGSFRNALKQSEVLSELNATQARIKANREGAQKIAEINATNAGKVAVAGIKARSAMETTNAKVNALADHYKLSADVRKSMLGLASHYLDGLTAQKDAAGEPVYTPEQLDPIMHTLVGYAEDHSPLFVSETGTPTTPAPPTAKPPKLGAHAAPSGGPKPTDTVAEAFARRRAAREQTGQK